MKRLWTLCLVLCILSALISGVSAETLVDRNLKDPFVWQDYSVTKLGSDETVDFSCEIPEDGAQVFVFFSPYCGNSMAFLDDLNCCAWVANPYVDLTAINIADDATQEDISTMLETYAINVLDYLDVYAYQWGYMAYDYRYLTGQSYAITMPMVLVFTESDQGRMIRFAEVSQTDTQLVYEALYTLVPAFADYENSRDDLAEPPHVHNFGSWDYAQEPDCTNSGTMVRTCDCGKRYTKKLDPLGHSCDEGSLIQAPTKTQSGIFAGKCTRCDAQAQKTVPALGNTTATYSGDLNQTQPTRQSLKLQWETVTDAEEYFATQPSVTAPYAPGALTEELLQSGLSYLNFVRYAAHLPQVGMKDELNENGQYGAVTLAAIDQLTHHPYQPADMDDEFYAKGYECTTSSNLHMRYGYDGNPLHYGIQGFMDDYGENNMFDLGHRRWLLNSVMGNVGFGYAQTEDGVEYVVTKVFDFSGDYVDYDFTSWPASGTFPVNVFGQGSAWSVSLNPYKYETPELSQVVVYLTRKSNGRTWFFDAGTGVPENEYTQHLTVSDMGYGDAPAIIFKPDLETLDEYMGEYTLTVTGIYDLQGNPTSICFDVDFFDVSYECMEHNYSTKRVEATCANPGHILYVCDNCGHSYQENFAPALEHDFTVQVVEPTCEQGGYRQEVCLGCDSVRNFEYINALGHSYGDWIYGTDGYAERECTRCGWLDWIPGNGSQEHEHTWTRWETVLESTTQQEGLRRRQCTGCGSVQEEILEKLTIRFSDVPTDAYYTSSVNWAVQNGVTTGTSPTTFAPDAQCTRAQVVTFLYRAAGEPAVRSATNPFKDVKKGDYYYNAVAWAVENGITTGTGADTFSPDAACTRAQVATFLWRARNQPASAGKNPFRDVKSGAYYYDAVIWAVDKGVTTGTSATTFEPDSTCTRAQIVTFLYRAIA